MAEASTSVGLRSKGPARSDARHRFSAALIALILSILVDCIGWRLQIDPSHGGDGMPILFGGIVVALLTTCIMSSVKQLPSSRNLVMGIGIGLISVLLSGMIYPIFGPLKFGKVDMGLGLGVNVAVWGLPAAVLGFVLIFSAIAYSFLDTYLSNDP